MMTLLLGLDVGLNHREKNNLKITIKIFGSYFFLLYICTVNQLKQFVMNLPVEEVNAKFEALGLLPNGKPVSFNKFKQFADTHEYGRGRNKLFIVFVGHPKQNLFAFYPPQTTKADSMAIAYEYYLDTVTTDMKQEYLDENVMWGNRGYPVSYGGIGVW